MLAFLLSTAIETGKMVAILTALMAALMVNRRTRRTTFAVVKFTNRHAPRWAKPAMIAAAFFPGQADEIVLVAILLFPILRNRKQRALFGRTLRYAWNG